MSISETSSEFVYLENHKVPFAFFSTKFSTVQETIFTKNALEIYK